jgi:5-dehydro-2-deoxygluconokinase
MLTDPTHLKIKHSQISAPEIAGNLNESIQNILSLGPSTLVVKRGARGATIFQKGQPSVDVPGFLVEVYNILGAGDAFASGLIYGYLKGWDWYKSARMGNACGAIVVTRHGCANFMAYEEEALKFIEERGGF